MNKRSPAMKKNSKRLTEPWFKHDFNASNDPKLIKINMKYGTEGLGIYWILVELIYRENGQASMEDIEAEIYYKRMNESKTKAIIKMAFNTTPDGLITCTRIDNAIKEREELSETRANAAKKRYSKKEVSLPNWMDENGERKQKNSEELSEEEKEKAKELASKLLGDKK